MKELTAEEKALLGKILSLAYSFMRELDLANFDDNITYDNIYEIADKLGIDI